jgi:hypothetical protein
MRAFGPPRHPAPRSPVTDRTLVSAKCGMPGGWSLLGGERSPQLIFSASALGFATTAQAEPIRQIDAYNSCFKQAKPREGGTAASFDCCVVAGGTWTGGTNPAGFCELKNVPVPRPGRLADQLGLL